MQRMMWVPVIMTILAPPVLAQKITIDYAREFDFAAVETYQYIDTKESNAPDQQTNDRIKYAIIRELSEGGLSSVSSDPDIYVTYHLISEDAAVYDTTVFEYGGHYDGWVGWGGGAASSTAESFISTEGILIVDAYEPTEKKMVWHGTGIVVTKKKPEKQTKQITKILAKLGKKWDEILAGQER